VASLTIAPFPSTPLSLGLLCNFVSRFPPFDTFEFKHMTVTLRHQLEAHCNLVAGFEDEIVGYLGWIRTTTEIAEAWIIDEGPLTAVSEDASASASAAAVTVLVASNPRFMLPMIRHAKAAHPALHVYWKREFAEGKRPVKRSVRKKPE
jgi:hypothetical protein